MDLTCFQEAIFLFQDGKEKEHLGKKKLLAKKDGKLSLKKKMVSLVFSSLCRDTRRGKKDDCEKSV